MAATSDPHESKSTLRARMRRLLRERTADPAPVCRALDAWLTCHPAAETIAVYFPLPGEVDLTEVARFHGGRRWVYPRVDGADLCFHVVANPAADLTSGAYGVMEPSPRLPGVRIDEIDLFLCPGLAFDRNGGRLGRGKGFYDRMLSQARPDAVKVGVCFPWQLVAAIHHEAHDVRMDVVICGER